MDDKALSERVAALRPPNLTDARERAKLAARVALAAERRTGTGRSAPDSGAARRRRGPGRLLRPTLAGLACLVIVATTLTTAPGRAVADWVGERVGLGQPGGPPTLGEWHDEVDAGIGDDPVVIAADRTGDGQPFEFLTWRDRANHARCFGFDMPSEPSLSSSCFERPLPRHGGIRIESLSGGDGSFQMVARISHDVDAVEVTLGDRSIPVKITPVDPALLEELRLDPPFNLAVAAFDLDRHGGDFTAKAMSADGRVLSVERQFIPHAMAAQAPRPRG